MSLDRAAVAVALALSPIDFKTPPSTPSEPTPTSLDETMSEPARPTFRLQKGHSEDFSKPFDRRKLRLNLLQRKASLRHTTSTPQLDSRADDFPVYKQRSSKANAVQSHYPRRYRKAPFKYVSLHSLDSPVSNAFSHPEINLPSTYHSLHSLDTIQRLDVPYKQNEISAIFYRHHLLLLLSFSARRSSLKLFAISWFMQLRMLFRQRGHLTMTEKYNYELSKSQLKASSRTSALLAGFAMVALVELQYDETTPRSMLVLLGVVTTLLVSVHLLALMMSTCILPYMEANGCSRDSPHFKLKFYIDLSWFFSTCVGLLLFLVEIGIIFFIKFQGVNFILAAYITTAILVPVVVIFVVISSLIHRSRFTYTLSRMDDKVKSLRKITNEERLAFPLAKKRPLLHDRFKNDLPVVLEI